MANKLPWFTHDHNARSDEFIQKSIDQFGHFGYAAFFMIVELLHEHGTGDILVISQARLAQNLRSRWPQVRLYLDFCRSSGKVDFRLIGTEVHLQIKKFRERQSKLKSNLPSTFLQPSVNLPTEKKEKEIEKEKSLAPAAPKIKSFTPIQQIIRAFKEAKRIDADDVEWDKKHFKRFARAAADIEKIFKDRTDDAVEYILAKGDEFDTQNLVGWGLEGIARAAATDPRAERNHGGENGRENGKVGAAGVVRSERSGITAAAGSLVGDALRAIESDAVRTEESAVLAGPSEDQDDDHETFA